MTYALHYLSETCIYITNKHDPFCRTGACRQGLTTGSNICVTSYKSLDVNMIQKVSM